MKLAKQKLLFLSAILIALSCFAQVAKSQSFTLIKSNYLPTSGSLSSITMETVSDNYGNSDAAGVWPGVSFTSPYPWYYDPSTYEELNVQVRNYASIPSYLDCFLYTFVNGVQYSKIDVSFSPGNSILIEYPYINNMTGVDTIELRLEQY